MSTDMEFWKDIAAIAQALAATLAIAGGAFLAFLRFVLHRLGYPRADIDLTVQDTALLEGQRLIHAALRIRNTGSVVLKPNCAELRLREIVPLPAKVSSAIQAGSDPVPKGRSEVEWPMIGQREWDFRASPLEIEPGESDSLHADFFVDPGLALYELYAFVGNTKKKKQGVGWTLTKICEFNSK